MKIDCPACGFTLRGHPTSGYRCVQCHARYSTKFVRGLRTKHVRAMIHAHFGEDQTPKHDEAEDDVIVIKDDDATIESAIDEARDSIDDVITEHKVEEEPSVKDTLPHEWLQKEKDDYGQRT